MDVCNLRNNKIQLKAPLMKDVEADKQRRVLLSKNDEWRKEHEWDTLYEEISNKEGISFNESRVRKPSIKKSIKARTTGKAKRTIKSSVNQLYGKKGMGWVMTLRKPLTTKYIIKQVSA